MLSIVFLLSLGIAQVLAMRLLKLELMGINTMSEKQEGERVWLIVYDDTHPCKSYTNEDVNYYKDFGDYFAPREKRRAICRALIMKANAIA